MKFPYANTPVMIDMHCRNLAHNHISGLLPNALQGLANMEIL